MVSKYRGQTFSFVNLRIRGSDSNPINAARENSERDAVEEFREAVTVQHRSDFRARSRAERNNDCAVTEANCSVLRFSPAKDKAGLYSAAQFLGNGFFSAFSATQRCL